MTSLRLWKARGDDRGGGDVGWIWGFRVGEEEEGVVWGRVGGWVEWRRGVEQNKLEKLGIDIVDRCHFASGCAHHLQRD